ncbi:hypothetical protein QFC20_004611 [Naganishia adeliensis]|uniref:Uncharacterized protein n=1 Tax=Naganishia adeliensis TaxID=92952 RepID=A0ACC2VYX4_9TREE|nr:hypothetical protein QFC20_004611 [Naganishia adeliensis]
MNNQRKRPRHAPDPSQDPSTSAQDFSVRAYEATLVYGQERFAELLRLPEDRGGHLMRWIGDSGEDTTLYTSFLHHHLTLSSDHVPASPASSTGWTDLPSDAEDTFFLSEDEGHVYSRGKKRRRMEAGRRERMEALRLKGEAEEEEERGKRGWMRMFGEGMPPAAIRTLMEHTAKSLLASPNSQVLELRILTHHAGDTRFSFLKGRYKDTWESIKRGEKPAQAATTTGSSGLGGLMGGYDSDDESEEGDPPLPPPFPPSQESPAGAETQIGSEAKTPPPPPPEDNDVLETSAVEAAVNEEEKQARELRKEKAKAWMAARRQERLNKET